MEDLDRATLASPPQHIIHEVSCLISQSLHRNSSQSTRFELGLPASLQLCASSPNGGKLVEHIHWQLFDCAFETTLHFFPFAASTPTDDDNSNR